MVREKYHHGPLANPQHVPSRWSNIKNLDDVAGLKPTRLAIAGPDPPDSAPHRDKSRAGRVVKNTMVTIVNTPARRERRMPDRRCGLKLRLGKRLDSLRSHL